MCSSTTRIAYNDFDELQRKALDVLSEKSDADASFLYYNSRNSGGARPKAVYKAADGSDCVSSMTATSQSKDSISKKVVASIHSLRQPCCSPDTLISASLNRSSVQQAKGDGQLSNPPLY